MRTQQVIKYLRSNWQEALVAAALFLWVFGQLLFSFSSVVGSRPRIAGMGIDSFYKPLVMCALAVVIIVRRKSMRPAMYVALGCVAVVFCISFLRTEESQFLVLLVFLVAIQGMRIRVLFRSMLAGMLAALVVVLLLGMLGSSTVRYDSPNGFLVSCYGFVHPNSYGCLLFGITTTMVLSFDLKRTWLPLAVLCLGSAACTLLLLSCRTAAVLQVALAVFCLAYGLAHGPIDALCAHRATRVVIAAIPIALVIAYVALLVAFVNGNEFAAAVNSVIGHRMSQAAETFASSGFTLFGRPFEGVSMFESYQSTKAFASIDSAYYRGALVNGIASMICCAILYVRSVLSDGHKDWPWASILVIALLYSLYLTTETAPTFVTINASLLFLTAGVETGVHEHAEDQGGEHVATSRLAWPVLPAIAGVTFAACLALTFFLGTRNGTGQTTAAGDFPESMEFKTTNDVNGASGEASFQVLPDGQMRIQYAGADITGTPRRIYTSKGNVCYNLQCIDAENGVSYVAVFSKPLKGSVQNPDGIWMIKLMSTEGMEVGSRLRLSEDGTYTFGSTRGDVLGLKPDETAPFEREGTWSSSGEGADARVEGTSESDHLQMSAA